MEGKIVLGYSMGATNSPSSANDWHLLSFINANKRFGSQLATGDGGICYRERYGENWGSWNHLNVKCTQVVNGNYQVVSDGNTSITVSRPSDFHQHLCISMRRCWPMNTWNDNGVFITQVDYNASNIVIHLGSQVTQTYAMIIDLIYL